MKRKLTFIASYEVEVEIDDTNFVVRDYGSDQELVDDVVSYRFMPMLPVIGQGGVVVKDVTVVKSEIQH